MEWIAITVTLAVIVAVIIGIMVFRFSADITLLAALTILLAYGVVDPVYGIDVREGLAGFANPGVITVAVLFVVADGLNRTGALAWVGMRLLGIPKGRVSAQLRTMVPAAFLSSVLNNTPVVALMMPVISDWSRKHRISISHLFMPLSYAAILGGMCTSIGTSTTIVVDSLLPEADRLSLFELSLVGFPAMVVGLAYITLTTKWLLPERKPAFTVMDDPREYTVEMQIDPASPLVGKTIEQAGLRHLPGVYLMEIDRDGHVLPAVSSDTPLQANDQLVFVGVVESVVDLQRIPGLKPATDQLFKLDSPRNQRCLVEAVVSGSYPFLRMTIRESKFRSTYNAAVIAVNRDGIRLPGKIGDIKLQSGDTLLLEANPGFIEQQRNSRHFFLVSEVQNSAPLQHERAWIARLLMAAFILAVSLLSYFEVRDAAMLAALPTAMLMILFRCTRAADARRAIDWNIILVMAAGIGIGAAMEKSTASQAVISTMSQFVGQNPYVLLGLVYLMSVVLTNMITAKAAAVLMYQVAVAASLLLDNCNQAPFVIAVIMGAAASFATPYGYQTNMMVYGPGGYRSTDYLRLGAPLSLLVGIIVVILVPIFWPFFPPAVVAP